MRTLLLIALWFALIVPGGCTSNPPTSAAAPGTPAVKVRLLDNQTAVTVLSRGASVQLAGQPIGSVFATDAPSPLKLTESGWTVHDRVIGRGELIVQPTSVGAVRINNAAYRGFYRFVPTGKNTFDVVNDVSIDDYLRGVVAKEMLAGWDEEAYKAQAIVARTYALFEAKTTPLGRHWDLFPDERSQVYGGLSAESEKARNAVDQTAGVVVVYGPSGQEKIFKTYFSSCCGGIGQDPLSAFNEPYHPAMAGQNVGTQCSASPRYKWGPVIVSKAELTRRIKKFGENRQRGEAEITRLTRIEPQLHNRAGRPVRYVLTDANNRQYSLTGEELRWAVNTDAPKDAILWSSFIEPQDAGDSIRFSGRGFGHGVGMCQWCAQSLSRQGISHEDIVVRSYPGAKLERAY